MTLWPGYPHFLGPDIAACTPDTFLAAPGFAVGQGLVWRTPTATSTEAVIRVRQTGVYSATFTSRGCVYKDSITVSGGAQAVGIALRVNGALLAPGQDTATASLPVRVVASPERSVRGPIWQGGIAADSLAITATRDTAITINLAYADSAGCPGIAQRVLHLRIALTDFVLPNLVTANGDEVNEYLTSKTPLPPGAMRIYDRWGRLAYEQNPYNGRWPDAGVRVGTYFYLFTTAAGKRYTGWVEVVR